MGYDITQYAQMQDLCTYKKINGHWYKSHQYTWDYGAWSACPAPCEQYGTVHRSAQCRRDGIAVDNKLCTAMIGAPVTSQSCYNSTPCCRGNSCYRANPHKSYGSSIQWGTVQVCADRKPAIAGIYTVSISAAVYAATRKDRGGTAELLYFRTNTGSNVITASGNEDGISCRGGSGGSRPCSLDWGWYGQFHPAGRWCGGSGTVRMAAYSNKILMSAGIRTNSGGHAEKCLAVGCAENNPARLGNRVG